MYSKACSLVCSYKCAFPELAPECVLQELLARGPKWFRAWWLAASPFTRSGLIQDSGLLP